MTAIGLLEVVRLDLRHGRLKLRRAKLGFLFGVMFLSLMFLPSVLAMPVTVKITPTSETIPQGTVASYTVGLSGAPSTTDGYDLTLSGLV